MKTILIIINLFICGHILAGDHFVFSHISSIDGLSENRVRVITQLPDGRMIIVTEGLVNIYDGASFHYIHFNDEHAYPLANYKGYHHAYIDNEGYLWLKNYNKLLLFDITRESFVPDIKTLWTEQGITSTVTDFFMDTDHNFWYLTQNDDLIYRNTKTKKNILFLKSASKPHNIADQILDIVVCTKQVFLFYKSGWMVCFDMDTHNEINRNNFLKNQKEAAFNTLMVAPFQYYLYTLYNSSNGGILFRYDITNKKQETVLQTDFWLNTLTIDSKGNSWVSSAKGIWQINKNIQEKQFSSQFQLVNGDIFKTEISTQFNDNKGGLWIGTYDRGMLYYHPERFKFRNFGPGLFKKATDEELRVISIVENKGDVFAGTTKGLFFYPRNAQTLSLYPGIPPDVRCSMLLKDSKQRIWLCTDNYGLYSIEQKVIRHYPLPLNNYSLYESSSDQFYLYSREGLMIFVPKNGNYYPINAKGHEIKNIYQVVDYSKDTIIGISGSGPFIFDCKNKVSIVPGTKVLKKNATFQHSNHQYNSVFVDSRNLIWFATQDGLNVWDLSNNTSKAFFAEDGLVNNCIRSILEDNQHRIWISTANGISRIDIAKKDQKYDFSIVNFNRYDGVIKNEFMPRSACKTSDNRLLWGGLDGFNEIDLNLIDSSIQQLSAPLFTRFFLSGVEVKHGEVHGGKIILQHSIAFTNEIKLNHTQNFINFEFSALNYINPTQTYYRYYLEGIDNSWHIIKTNDGIGRAGYTNLSPGTYKLKVGASYNSRLWKNNQTEITITIQPPFWKTPVAYALYFLLFILVLYFSIFYYTRRNRLKMERRQKEELDQMKFSFFTNISHELRTPLTLILTPLDTIIKKTSEGKIKAQLTGIYRNANELLKLVNQLLDFRKLEMKGETLQLSYCNIGEFLETIILPFEELLSNKEIAFSWECRDSNLYAYIDKDKFRKIINNLLSNAYKFTSKGGKILVIFEKSFLNAHEYNAFKIQISDTGCGIPANELPKIFERFYQIRNTDNSNTGSGIGLHLVKEYIQLHNGQIEVNSTENLGSTFTVNIPANLHLTDDNPYIPEYDNNSHSLKLLVVEDNDEFRNFLLNELSENYSVIAAANGQEGLEKAIEHMPDLVISDVMMPVMSGIELCRKLKTDVRISHIPVIILTARASDKAQIEGLEAKADAYITKPFNMDILQLSIQHLLEQQEQRRNLYKKAIIIQPGSLTSTHVDEEFIKKAVGFIEKNMSDPSYLVEELSRDLCMERTGLYRKLVAIAGQKPSSFIRSVRLKRAAQLIVKGIPVSEVAETVGYGTTSYFSRCFLEEFGVSPSQYKVE
jgi:signal transduction histidine kinase/DNA-binding response OmpR family regulator